MDVYEIKANGDYGGGVAIVAAPSEGDAIRLASTIYDLLWSTDYSHPYSVALIEGVSSAGPARVLTHFETGE